MSRSFIHLRRALFGVSCAIVFGFGATQAFAAPQETTRGGTCTPYAPGANAYCHDWCLSQGHPGGKCVLDGTCACLINP